VGDGERQVRQALEAAPAQAVHASRRAVMLTDAPGPRLVDVNPAGEALTGHRRDQLVGDTLRMRALRAALDAGEGWEGTASNDRADGTPFVISWRRGGEARRADPPPAAGSSSVTSRATAPSAALQVGRCRPPRRPPRAPPQRAPIIGVGRAGWAPVVCVVMGRVTER
jgi:PAS domain